MFYNILIEFGIPMKQERLINMRLNETYSTVHVGMHLSISPIRGYVRQGEGLSPMLFNKAVECTIRTVKVNRDCLKLYCTH